MGENPAVMNEWMRVDKAVLPTLAWRTWARSVVVVTDFANSLKRRSLEAEASDFVMCGLQSSSNEASPQPSACDSPQASRQLWATNELPGPHKDGCAETGELDRKANRRHIRVIARN